MEENNKNLNETPVSDTSNTDTTTNTSASVFGAPTTNSESTAPASDSTSTNSESIASDSANTSSEPATPVSAFGSSNTNPTPDAPVSAFGSPNTNPIPATQAPAAGSTNTNQTTTQVPSYYTSPGSNSTASNTYVYNDTIVTTSDETSTGFGIASLVMGIISIFASCCCGLGLLFSIMGIIFGCLQPKDAYGKKPGIAIAGIVLSSVAILFSIIAIIYFMAVGTFADTL